MKITVFGTKPYDRRFLAAENERLGSPHALLFLEPNLSPLTAPLADGSEAVCAFVNDDLGAACLERLAAGGVQTIAMRCAGFNNVDLATAQRLGLTVVRVPAYSPDAVAEHAVALIMTLNRKTHRAHNRVREGNFALDGLLGFDMHGKTVGVVGTGRIGACFCRIMVGFGCKVLAYDVHENPAVAALGASYRPLAEVLGESDIVSLHCPLMPATQHLVNRESLAGMRRGVMLINTSRGGLIDTRAVVAGLKSGQVGYLGMDVYEEEAELFFEDKSDTVIQDDVFARLLTFPNVLITGHQAFFTDTALGNIAATTLANLGEVAAGTACKNALDLDALVKSS